jgi:hypothetical protein
MLANSRRKNSKLFLDSLPYMFSYIGSVSYFGKNASGHLLRDMRLKP